MSCQAKQRKTLAGGYLHVFLFPVLCEELSIKLGVWVLMSAGDDVLSHVEEIACGCHYLSAQTLTPLDARPVTTCIKISRIRIH